VFDDAGRLWAVTATAYPIDLDPKAWTKPGPDRVVVIDDPTGPGPHVARTFADGLVMPTGVLPHRDGAFVAQGPELFFLADRDGDGRADQRTTLLRGFGVQDSHTLPHQLARAPGARLVFSQGVLNHGVVLDVGGRGHLFNHTIVASVKFGGTDLRFLAAGLNNIWSWAPDRLGRVFIHEANDLGYSLIPFEEDTSFPSFYRTKLHPDAPMHPPTAVGLDLGGTGFSGLAICDDRSGSFPAPWHGEFFVANPILGRVHAVRGTLRADGTWAFEKHADLVACADPMFRPVAITFGPDGCLYITDWYNRIISHNEVARDHPARDKERGRIWRVRHASQPPAVRRDLTRTPTADLPAALVSDSGWEMRAAWHQIADRQDQSVLPALLTLLGDSSRIDTQIHALWALEELGHFDPLLWARLLGQPSADLRREAVRALGTLRVPQTVGAPLLLRALREEKTSAVRYAVLRYFRQAEGPLQPETLSWLHTWRDEPAPSNETKGSGWVGTTLALDGSYQHAFQNFLLGLAETKTRLPVIEESKFGGVIATRPAPSDPRLLAERIVTVKAALPAANLAEGRALTEGICLTCHSIGGKGVGFAPPLDGSASRDLEGLLNAILAPDAAIESVFRNYRIVTRDGQTHEGFNQGEGRRDITLRSMGGGTKVILLKDIASAGYVDGQSVMPDLTAAMPPATVASIVAYLHSLK
jgi:putative membrane-bound dehydrogenase-like protein